MVGSYRQTETDKRHPLTRMLDSFTDDPRFVSMTLPPLSPSEHRTLVESVVGAPRVSDALAERLRDATEGNPFFTKELIRSLVESGGIARDDTGAWSFSKEAEISADSLPATIQQAVEKRIERLPEKLRGIVHGLPPPTFHFRRGGAAIIVPATVIPNDEPVTVGYPGEDRNVVSEQSELIVGDIASR